MFDEEEEDELFQWWWEATVPEIEKQVAEFEAILKLLWNSWELKL